MMKIGWNVDSQKYNYSLYWVKSIRCNCGDCRNLSTTLFKMSDIPEKFLGKIVPTYDVYVNICREHIKKYGIEGEPIYLDFATIDDEGNGHCLCLRCHREFHPHLLKRLVADHPTSDLNNIGKLPSICPNCGTNKWRTDPIKRAPSTVFMKQKEAEKVMNILTTGKKKIVKGGVK